MVTGKVKDIEIRCLEEDSDVMDAVKLVIERNYQAFLLYLKGKKIITLYEDDDPNVCDMHDFEVDFYKVIGNFMQYTTIKDILENASLVNWYLYFFSDRNNGIASNVEIMNEVTGEELDELSNEEINELFNLLIRYRYYKENGTIEEFLKNHLSSRDVDIVFEWLQEVTRFPLYNALFSIMIDEIKTDEYLYKNLGKLYILLVDVMKNELDCNISVNLPKISIEEIYEYMFEFFDYLKAPPIWKEKFLELIDNNRLIVIKEEDVDPNNKNMRTCFYFDGEIPKIRLIATGKIDDFTALVHEFIHYLNCSLNLDFVRFVILELPSIFFEKMGARFLVKKEYSNDIIKYVDFIHRFDNFKCSIEDSFLVYRIIDYINNQGTSLTREFDDIVNHGERCIRLGTYELYSDDPDEIVEEIKNHLDEINNRLLNHGAQVLIGIQYILAMKIIDNIDMEKALPLMLDIAENIDCYSLENVLRLFDVDVFGDICKKITK